MPAARLSLSGEPDAETAAPVSFRPLEKDGGMPEIPAV